MFLCAAPRCSFSVNCKSTGKLIFPTISVGVKYHRLLLLHVLYFYWTTLECLEKTLKLFITCRRLDSHLTQLINHIKIHYKKISTHNTGKKTLRHFICCVMISDLLELNHPVRRRLWNLIERKIECKRRCKSEAMIFHHPLNWLHKLSKLIHFLHRVCIFHSLVACLRSATCLSGRTCPLPAHWTLYSCWTRQR